MKPMTLEELQTLIMPVELVCFDGVCPTDYHEITVLASTPDKANYLPISANGLYGILYAETLKHYASHKQPIIKRFYEYVGSRKWYSDDGYSFDVLSVYKSSFDTNSLLKTGRYFYWDMDANKIIGKVEVE